MKDDKFEMEYASNFDLATNFYNQKTQQWDVLNRNQLDNITDEQAKQYISQIPAAQLMYDVYRSMGKSVLEAMKEVLEATLRA